jgi:hypothetical protein
MSVAASLIFYVSDCLNLLCRKLFFFVQLFQSRKQTWRQFFSRACLIVGSQLLADYFVGLGPVMHLVRCTFWHRAISLGHHISD